MEWPGQTHVIQLQELPASAFSESSGENPESNATSGLPLVCLDSEVRGFLRFLLKNWPMLRTEWETQDFFQETSSRFLSRLKQDKLKRLSPEHANSLWKLIARQVGSDQLRRMQTTIRDIRREKKISREQMEKARKCTPFDSIEALELINRVRATMSPRDWSLIELHSEGLSWVEIAREIGGKPNSLRIRYGRLLAKISATFEEDGTIKKQ